MDNTITIHNIERYTQQIINGHLVLTRIFPNPSTPPASSHNEDDSDDSDDPSIKRDIVYNSDDPSLKRDLVFKVENQEYAQIKHSNAGNNMFSCYCFDGVTRLGHIRDKMRKKVWVTAGDIVLCGLRDFQDGKVDIIYKYTADEARNLKSYGELPDSVIINETD